MHMKSCGSWRLKATKQQPWEVWQATTWHGKLWLRSKHALSHRRYAAPWNAATKTLPARLRSARVRRSRDGQLPGGRGSDCIQPLAWRCTPVERTNLIGENVLSTQNTRKNTWNTRWFWCCENWAAFSDFLFFFYCELGRWPVQIPRVASLFILIFFYYRFSIMHTSYNMVIHKWHSAWTIQNKLYK